MELRLLGFLDLAGKCDLLAVRQNGRFCANDSSSAAAGAPVRLLLARHGLEKSPNMDRPLTARPEQLAQWSVYIYKSGFILVRRR